MLKLPPVDKIAKYYQKPGGKKTEFVKINNTVHIFVKDTIIEVSGAVLARRSKVLEERIVTSTELVLREFSDNINGLCDCLDLMYDETVEIKLDNVKAIYKFGKNYQVEG